MVTFFRENQVPCRPPRAVKPHPRRKKPKYDLPVPNFKGQAPANHTLGLQALLMTVLKPLTRCFIVQIIFTFFSVVPSERNSENRGQPCKKHELYVSFSDLGWKVSPVLVMLIICLLVTYKS